MNRRIASAQPSRVRLRSTRVQFVEIRGLGGGSRAASHAGAPSSGGWVSPARRRRRPARSRHGIPSIRAPEHHSWSQAPPIVAADHQLEPALLRPRAQPPLTGSECSSNGDTVLDFWRWAMGDLRMNNTRGCLAEYLVARAVNAEAT